MVTERKIRNSGSSLWTPASTGASKIKTGARATAPLDNVSDFRVQNMAINRRTALFIDRLDRDQQSAGIGRRIASALSALATSSLYVYAFDSAACAQEHQNDSEPADGGLAGRQAVAEQAAIGAPLFDMRRKGHVVDQIVIVTEGREDRSPRFADALAEYRRALSVNPSVVVVRVGDFAYAFEDSLRASRVAVRGLGFDGPGSLSRLISVLATPSRLDRLVDRIESPV
ncbi:MAG TPA: hypothetical protein VLZ81_15125 [Blastocatellia bacterium]|nr:hypothetical protein [Blastocatellia bacterium]